MGKPAEVDDKTEKAFTTNIPVNRMAGRFEGNVRKCAVVGSVAAGV
jgi:hypothetical protein